MEVAQGKRALLLRPPGKWQVGSPRVSGVSRFMLWPWLCRLRNLSGQCMRADPSCRGGLSTVKLKGLKTTSRTPVCSFVLTSITMKRD